MEKINQSMQKLRDKTITMAELGILDELLYKTIHSYWHGHITGQRSQKALDYLDQLEQEYLELKIKFLLDNL